MEAMVMVECSKIHGDIGAYYDGECDPDRRGVIEEHLRGCARCRKELEDWTWMASKTFHRRPHSAPASRWPRIASKIALPDPLPVAAKVVG